MSSLDPPTEIAPLFDRAGWHARRQSCAPSTPEAAHPAEQVLASFAGLVVRPEREAGVDCSTSVISFGRVQVRDPLIPEWEALLNVQLIPIGECDFGHGALLMATDGRCFGTSNIHVAFYFLGSTFWEAVAGLLTGHRAKPMLLPRQETVTLYGQVFDHGSPGLYAPDTHTTRAGAGEA